MTNDFIYEFIYNSNAIEGNPLELKDVINVINTNKYTTEWEIETINYLNAINYILSNTNELSIDYIKHLHYLCRVNTKDIKLGFNIGEFKSNNNIVGNTLTIPKQKVKSYMNRLVKFKPKTYKDILKFHIRFEKIHPFQDGNGRVGRLIMLKQCLDIGLDPFIIYCTHRDTYYYLFSNNSKYINSYIDFINGKLHIEKLKATASYYKYQYYINLLGKEINYV